MGRVIWKPGNMLYPVPAVLVSVQGKEGNDNLITVAWTGTVCSEPAMTYVSVRRERYSYTLLKETGEYVINLVPAGLARALDLCGVKSGRDGDKFALAGLTRLASAEVKPPSVAECPVSIECRVTQVLELGSHDMFLGKVAAVTVDKTLLQPSGKLDLSRANLITYSHGEYFAPGRELGNFGFSVKKRQKQ